MPAELALSYLMLLLKRNAEPQQLSRQKIIQYPQHFHVSYSQNASEILDKIADISSDTSTEIILCSFDEWVEISLILLA
mgnify:CR=1 FL=1